jgi:hypothetical protein
VKNWGANFSKFKVLSMKTVLQITLAQLLALSLVDASIVYKEVIGQDPAADYDLDQVLSDILDVADPAPDELEGIESDTFSYGGKKYSVAFPKVEIPGIGIRTALELLHDEEAQKYLVEQGCVGSVIIEVA